MGLVEVVHDGVAVALILSVEVFAVWRAAGYVFGKAGYLASAGILPGIGAAPMVVEPLLHGLHLRPHGFFGIGLHARVDGGVDAQSVGIEVELVDGVVAWHMTVVAKLVDVGLECLAEVGCHAVLIALANACPQGDGQCQQRIELFCRGFFSVEDEVSEVIDLLQHGVSAAQAVLGIEARVVVAGGFEQSDQCGCLFVGDGIGRGAEVGACCRLDAIGVAAEVYGVEVHGQNLFLREEPLQLCCHYPFLGLHDENPDAWQLSEQSGGVLCPDAEEVLGKLLGDGAGASCMAAEDVLAGGEEADEVDAMMLIESLVLGVDEGANQGGRYLFVGDGCAVLVEEASHEHFVAGVDLGCFAHHGVLDVVEAWRASEEVAEVAVDGNEEKQHGNDEGDEPSGCLLVPGAGINGTQLLYVG